MKLGESRRRRIEIAQEDEDMYTASVDGRDQNAVCG